MTDTRPGDRDWLFAAIDLSRRCPPSTTAYSVGAVVVNGHGQELARGYSRDSGPHIHAEQSALGKLAGSGIDLSTATIYSSLEPCSTRRSPLRPCTQLILAAGIRRVVFALREPPIFVDCHGVELLQAAGVTVIEMTDLANQVMDINAHLLGTHRR
jgi:pyrimidine deaminase RibD-like protein